MVVCRLFDEEVSEMICPDCGSECEIEEMYDPNTEDEELIHVCPDPTCGWRSDEDEDFDPEALE